MELFRRKGSDGVNMRELAEKAAVNKGLLHYYFKSKEAIFREVFIHHAGLLWSEVREILEGEGELPEKLPLIVERYFALLGRMPSMPAFVLFEVQKDPGMLAKTALKENMMRAAAALTPELRRRGLPPDRAEGLQFLLDLVALTAFTFGMLPGIAKVLKLNKARQAAFLEQRKAHIISVLQQSFRL